MKDKPEHSQYGWRSVALVMMLVCASVLCTAYTLGSGDSGNSIPVVIESGSGVETASYIIYQDDGYTCLKNGTTGRIELRDLNSSYVIQSAIDGLTSDRVYMEAIAIIGNYSITWPIVVYSYTCLNLQFANLEKNCNGSIISTNTQNVTDVSIIGGHLNGQTSDYHTSHTLDNAIEIGVDGGHSTNISVTNVCIRDIYGTGILLLGCCNFIISECSINNADYHGICVTGGSQFGVVDSCYATYVAYYSFYIFGSKDITVSDCISDHCGKAFVGEGVPNQTIERVDFIGCHAYNFTNLGFHIENPGPPTYANGLYVSHIRFISCTAEAYAGNGSTVMWLFLVNGASTPFIDDVTFQDCYGDGNDKAYYGMQIYASNFKIINCVIRNCTGQGIVIQNSPFANGTAHNGVIIGNIVYNIDHYGIMVGGGAASISIVGNNAYNCTDGGYLIGGTNNIFENNIGYVNENSGSAIILSGNTYVTVTHGLKTTPTKIVVTGTNNYTASCWVSNLGTTTFRIYVPSVVGANSTVYWYARV